ncbi:response regulator [Aphanothece sacrum]|uniref:Two-component response regulator n=1 Tax=Aphanothece sacrum FPU1 TaxID=1920663 RepID=A0A401ID54_APHSA|nr:response regulator [Aphanothece sacrum]GBF79218.1 two-component response regulator [Aphanothece sacrum FPU1]GBF86608.1 two-component response regulator [Aphanothece sacrum FPU3]
MNIMVVDDEQDIQVLFKQKFRKEIRQKQITFTFVFSAEEALNCLQNTPNDLILILADINMPGMNGLELLKIIKEKYAHLTVFMVTAYCDDKNYNTAIQYGADDYLSKPIEFETLKQKMLEVLKVN